MRIGTKDGGDGVRCWNKEAVTAYVDQVNAREAQVARDNPDVTVLPGQLVCYGCEVMDFDYGVKCTASLTRTRYAVQSEIQPRAEDAAGSLLDIAGLRSRAPEEIAAQAKTPQLATSASAPGGSGAAGSGKGGSGGAGGPGSSAASGASSSSTQAGPAAEPRSEGKRGGLRGLFGR